VNPGPQNSTGGSSAVPPDERLRQSGLRLMMAIAATLRVGRAYNAQNQVFLNQLENLLEHVRPIMQQSGEAVLVAHDSDLYLNGVRIPINKSSFAYQKTVLDLFERLAISGIRFEPGVTAQETSRMFSLFLKPDGPTGRALLAATEAEGMTEMTVILHASVDPSATREGGEGAADAVAAEQMANQIYEPRIEALEVSGRRRQSAAVQGARLLLMPTSLQTTLEVRHAKRVVQPLVEGVSLSEPVVVGLSTLSQRDEYTYAHAVNVCGIAVAIGHFLGLDRRALSDLGVAALLHDVGKQAVGGSITNDLERFTPEERAAAERHPVEGLKLLARSTSLNPTTLNCMRVALEHHVSAGEGYPALPEGWRPSLLSQIVSVSDCYISLQSRLSETAPPVSPTEALGMMLGPLARRFEPALLWALVRSVGFYPAGQVVELDDGSTGIVLAPNSEDPGRPHVRVMLGPVGTRLPVDRQTEYRPLPADRSVRRAIKIADYPDGMTHLADGEPQQQAA
jgi:HD-GYP domain-containing protein (c-di-GMP phosphodiesterase class II)